MAMQAKGKKIYRLESGDPNFDVDPGVAAAMIGALNGGQTHYTPSPGISQMREAVVHKMGAENGVVTTVEDVTITSGGMHALYLTFCALLESGDEVIIPDPMWTEIGENVKLAFGNPVRVPMDLSSEDFSYPPELIEKAITPRTKAIFINTPHNPTGKLVSRRNLEAILMIAEKHNLYVISDEAYEHLIFDGRKHVSFASLPGAYGRTISLYSCSKSYAMSGLRVGYIVGPNVGGFQDRVRKLLRCTTNGVNSLAQYGAAYAMGMAPTYSHKMRDEYQARRDLMVSALRKSGLFQPTIPDGSFFIWAKITEDWCAGRMSPDWDMTNHLITSYGIGSAPGSAFSAPGSSISDHYVRFSFSSSTPTVASASSVLASLGE
jgi:aspartate aminotransferase